jgi:Flp pilus assembly protein TadD
MNRFSLLQSAALALALTTGAAPAFAQTEIVQQTNPDADRLADEMRVLAADPRDMGALLSAANYSARLGDSSAALAFLQRAETLDPTNPRILAGRAAVLVRIERPGEALSLFQDAEARGYGPINYLSDRGFAYDLLGQPGLAQRDYRQALQRGGADDDTVRRYALSLGIVGKLDEAMAVLDPLLRRSDRAAWRARAFILAMNGDVPGAERIAASMMPGAVGAGLSPFFRRLGALSVANRAFAVHFGELTPTQARLADARLAPQLSPYVPEARQPVQVAAATPAPPAAAPDKSRRKDRRSRREDLAALTSASQAKPAPVQVASANPLPPPPAFVMPPLVQPIPRPTPAPPPAPVRIASGSQPVRFSARPAVTPVPTPAPVRTAAAESDYNIDEPIAARPRRAVSPPVERRPEAQAPVPIPPQPRPQPQPEPQPAPEPVQPVAQPELQPQPQPQPVEQPKPAARIGEEDSVLAKIVGGITIPGDELQKPSPSRSADAPAPQPGSPGPKLPARAASRTQARAEGLGRSRTCPVKVVAKPEREKARSQGGPQKARSQEAGREDRQARSQAEPKGKTPAKPDPKKSDPSRVWVQVAGGADECRRCPRHLEEARRQGAGAVQGQERLDHAAARDQPHPGRPVQNRGRGPGLRQFARKARDSASSSPAKRARRSPGCPPSEGWLAPWACTPEPAAAAFTKEQTGTVRGPRDAFQRDRDRIIHSISFRRLRTRPRSSWRPMAIISACG